MNIFIMILVILFMGTYYLVSSPSLRVREQETEYSINLSDLRSIAECASAAHNATIKGTTFEDICIEQNGITSTRVCMTSSMAITACDGVKSKKPAYSYIITSTAPLAESEYNNMLEILEQYYPDTGTFGIFMENKIISGGTADKRTVAQKIIDDRELTDGQLVYLTQYEIPDAETEFTAPLAADIECPVGTVKTYRFSRWQCVSYNTKTDCGGDMIWDSDLLECVPDESRKPLCASQQTAVMVDSVWECVNPFPDKNCPDNMIARLNYNTLEWECVTDPNTTQTTKKCAHITTNAIYGNIGATLRVPTTSCTDCETMLTDMDSCQSVCVPDPSKINDPQCYPSDTKNCSGPNRAFYFGFPSFSYAAQVSELKGKSVPLDRTHSQNRKFNCLDCGERGINESQSFPPYIAVCN